MMDDLISRKRAIEAIVNTPSQVQNKQIPLTDQYDGATFRQIEILGILDTLPPAQQWISVKERFPEDDKAVLITAWTDTLMIAWYYLDFWETEDCYLDLDEVKAWMPLPEPYKERG